MTHRFQQLAAAGTVLGLALLLGACSTQSTAPRLDGSFGLAVDTLRAQQTLNPNAAKEARDLPQGTDAETGQVIMQVYRESYSQPVQQNNTPAVGIGLQ